MAMTYAASGPAGAASTTSATAALIGVYNPASATMTAAKIYQIMVGPGANSADNTYSVRLRRNSTVSTWGTAVTPADQGPKATASISLSGVASTARGTLTAGNQGTWGFHMRGGMGWTAIPGGEAVVSFAFSNGLELEYLFAQGTDLNEATFMFSE